MKFQHQLQGCEKNFFLKTFLKPQEASRGFPPPPRQVSGSITPSKRLVRNNGICIHRPQIIIMRIIHLMASKICGVQNGLINAVNFWNKHISDTILIFEVNAYPIMHQVSAKSVHF